jgi:predicted amidophosphoribosyltransferase
MKNPKITVCVKCGHKFDWWDNFRDTCGKCGRRIRNPESIPHKVESINTPPPHVFGNEYPAQYSSKSMERKRRQGGRDLVRGDE